MQLYAGYSKRYDETARAHLEHLRFIHNRILQAQEGGPLQRYRYWRNTWAHQIAINVEECVESAVGEDTSYHIPSLGPEFFGPFTDDDVAWDYKGEKA